MNLFELIEEHNNPARDIDNTNAILQLLVSKSVDINQTKTTAPYKGFSALAMAVKKLTEQNSSRTRHSNIGIILALIIHGANTRTPCEFFSGKTVSPFAYLCFAGDINLVRTLFDFFEVKEDQIREVLMFNKTHQIKPDILNYLQNPDDFSYLIPKSYAKITRNKAIVEAAQLVMKDYYAPLILSFLHNPALQRLLTAHTLRHQDNLEVAKIHVETLELRIKELNSAQYKKLTDEERESILFNDYVNRLLNLNVYINEGAELYSQQVAKLKGKEIDKLDGVNPEGSLFRRIKFLNKELTKFVSNQHTANKASPASAVKANTSAFFTALSNNAAKVTRTITITTDSSKSHYYSMDELLSALSAVSGRVDTKQPFHQLSEHAYLGAPGPSR